MAVNRDATDESRYQAGRIFRVRTVCKSYIKLIRFSYHLTFVSVLLGTLFITNRVSVALVESWLLLYVSFNVLLYGGLYTINAITDRESDRKHPFKRKRPLPSGEVSVTSAVIFSLILLAGGMLTGLLWFGQNIFTLYVAFLALNAFYSLVAKRIPYLELIANAATHPLRFLMGALLVNGQVPIAMLTAYLFLAFGVATVRRCVEKNVEGWEARKTLETYTDQGLGLLRSSGLVAILMVSIMNTSVPRHFYWAILAIYFILVFGIDFYAPMRHLLVRIWTR